MIALMILFLL